jgi:hypothetical protein
MCLETLGISYFLLEEIVKQESTNGSSSFLDPTRFARGCLVCPHVSVVSVASMVVWDFLIWPLLHR